MENDDDNQPEPPPPPDYNRNIFKIYFYHYAANGYNELLNDYGRFRQPGIVKEVTPLEQLKFMISHIGILEIIPCGMTNNVVAGILKVALSI